MGPTRRPPAPRGPHDLVEPPQPTPAPRPAPGSFPLAATPPARAGALPGARLRRARAIGSWIALGVLVRVHALTPQVGHGPKVFLQIGYLLIAWFILARTKTLSWQSIAVFFSLCLPWSLVVATVTGALVGGSGSPGPGAALAQQSLVLLPLPVLALFGPTRVRQFAVTDWLLVGVVSGLSLQAVEAFARASSDGFRSPGLSLNPISAGASASPGAGFAGEHVLTGLVAVTIGLSIAAWRHSQRLPPGRISRRGWRGLALLGPPIAWWLAVSARAGQGTGLGSGAGQSLPWPLRLGRQLGPNSAAGWLLLLLLVLALLVDAARLRNAADQEEDPLLRPFVPARAADRWAGVLTGWTGTGTSGPVLGVVWVIASGCAAVAYAVRDLVVVVVAYALDPAILPANGPVDAGSGAAAGRARVRTPKHESRWTAMARGKAAGVMVRVLRAEAIALAAGPDSPPTRRATRWVAAGGLVSGLLVARLATPHWATRIGDGVTSAEAHGLIVLGFLVLMVTAAGPLDPPTGRFGTLARSTFLWERAERAGDSGRGPLRAIRGYLTLNTPTEALVDGVAAVLSFVPATVVGEGTRAEVRLAVAEFLAEPARFSAARRAAARRAAARRLAGGPVAEVPTPIRIRIDQNLPPIKLGDGRLVSVLTEADEQVFIATLDGLTRGNIRVRNESAEYQVRIYGDDERLISQRPEKWSDGQNTAYGMVAAVFFYDGAGTSWYLPEALPESIRHKAYLEMDRRLLEYAAAVYYPASPFHALEITTNHPLVAQVLRQRILRLAIPGYVVLEP